MSVKIVLIRYLNKVYISYYLVSEILLKRLLMGEIGVMHSITIPLFNLSNKLENSLILINYMKYLRNSDAILMKYNFWKAK